MPNRHAAPACKLSRIPALPPIVARVRQLDPAIWRMLTKKEPLTTEEWARLEELERLGP